MAKIRLYPSKSNEMRRVPLEILSQLAVLLQYESKNLAALIPHLTHVVQDDSDLVIRRRAMRTIRCLAGSMDIETNNFLQNGNLPSFLIDIISQNASSGDENENDIIVQACQTAIALKESIEADIWSQLQKAIVQRIESTTFVNIISAGAMCLCECTSRIPSAQSLSCFSIKFWNSIERSVSTSSETHLSISTLLTVIARMEKGLGNNGSQEEEHACILTKPPIINTLTTIISNPESGKGDSRNQALEVVQIIAEKEINKRLLAASDRLLSGLVSLCLAQPDSKIKESAKEIILQLVPEI